MKIVIRSDASPDIGTGHVIRCLTLAQALRGQGAEISFVSKELPKSLEQQLQTLGYIVEQVPGSDLVNPCDWLIVDHYGLDANWESAQRSYAKSIMAIDDLADRPHDCELLL